jgi:hypothetical protein
MCATFSKNLEGILNDHKGPYIEDLVPSLWHYCHRNL